MRLRRRQAGPWAGGPGEEGAGGHVTQPEASGPRLGRQAPDPRAGRAPRRRQPHAPRAPALFSATIFSRPQQRSNFRVMTRPEGWMRLGSNTTRRPPVAARSWGVSERRNPFVASQWRALSHHPRLLPAPQDGEEVHFVARKIRVEPGNLPGPRPVPCRGSSLWSRGDLE